MGSTAIAGTIANATRGGDKMDTRIVCAHCGKPRSIRTVYDGQRNVQFYDCACAQWWIENMLSLGLTPPRKRWEDTSRLIEVIN